MDLRIIIRDQNRDGRNQIPEVPLKILLTTCGHLFHKDCLTEHCSTEGEVPHGRKKFHNCPLCDTRFSFLNCKNVNAEPQIKSKMTQSSQRLLDLREKTNMERTKLTNLRIWYQKRETKYLKLKKMVEDIQNGTVQVQEPDFNITALKVRPIVQKIKSLDGEQYLPKPRIGRSKTEFVPDETKDESASTQSKTESVCNQFKNESVRDLFRSKSIRTRSSSSESFVETTELKNKLLGLLSTTQTMEKEMKEFHTNVYNTRVTLELDAYRKNSRDYFNSSRCEIARNRLTGPKRSSLVLPEPHRKLVLPKAPPEPLISQLQLEKPLDKNNEVKTKLKSSRNKVPCKKRHSSIWSLQPICSNMSISDGDV